MNACERLLYEGLHPPIPVFGVQNDPLSGAGPHHAPLNDVEFVRALRICGRNSAEFDRRFSLALQQSAAAHQETEKHRSSAFPDEIAGSATFSQPRCFPSRTIARTLLFLFIL